MQSQRALAVLRRPEYTGENRCIPCTVLNIALVAGASIVLAAGGEPLIGGVAAVFGIGLVYARGYVVPGTPTLTERFLPDRILAWFEHGEPPAATKLGDSTRQLDPGEALQNADALMPCAERDDLCLDPLFRAEWRSKMVAAAVDDDTLWELMPASFDGTVRVERRGDTYVARINDATIAEWPSRAAFVADAAGAMVLTDADPDWSERGFAERAKLLAGLRLWLEQCPVCDGHVELGEESVESCCRSVQVIAATCDSCDARIFEAPLPGE